MRVFLCRFQIECSLLLVLFAVFSSLAQSSRETLSPQENKNDRSFYGSRLDDSKAVYLLKDNFAVHGDGIGDDSDALQAAIDTVEQRSRNGIVFIPEGKYRIGETVHIWRGVKLIGYGKNRPVFLLGENTRGYQDGKGKYMIQFCNRRTREGAPIQDASSSTMFSEINNINIEMREGNPAAIAIRYHVAQLCALKHMNFQIGTALGGVEDMGNVIEDCNFHGGEWAIKTGITSAAWPSLLLDCNFEKQRKASIETDEAGMTIIRCKFKEVPIGILVSYKKERLYVKDTWFENISHSAIGNLDYFNEDAQVNLENITLSNVPISMVFASDPWLSYIPVVDKELFPGVIGYKSEEPLYVINKYSHGLHIESAGTKEINRTVTTINDHVTIESLGEFPKRDFPDLPDQKSWVNVVAMGARGDGTTDDSRIFKEAIEKYDAIYIPMGEYLLTETLVLREHTALIGLHPSMTRFVLKDGTRGYAEAENPKPLLVTPQGGSNIIVGLGFNLGVNPGVIGIKWMAGAGSYMDDVHFPPLRNSKKGEGQYYGLWITDGGGGTFKNIWACNEQARSGLFVSNTTTRGRIYEVSVEHHKDIEVRLCDVENWDFYALQTEENRGSEKCIALGIERCKNISFSNLYSYRLRGMRTPAFAAVTINNSHNIVFKNVHVFSFGVFPFDNALFDENTGMVVPHREIAKLTIK